MERKKKSKKVTITYRRSNPCLWHSLGTQACEVKPRAAQPWLNLLLHLHVICGSWGGCCYSVKVLSHIICTRYVLAAIWHHLGNEANEADFSSILPGQASLKRCHVRSPAEGRQAGSQPLLKAGQRMRESRQYPFKGSSLRAPQFYCLERGDLRLVFTSTGSDRPGRGRR